MGDFVITYEPEEFSIDKGLHSDQQSVIIKIENLSDELVKDSKITNTNRDDKEQELKESKFNYPALIPVRNKIRRRKNRNSK